MCLPEMLYESNMGVPGVLPGHGEAWPVLDAATFSELLEASTTRLGSLDRCLLSTQLSEQKTVPFFQIPLEVI